MIKTLVIHSILLALLHLHFNLGIAGAGNVLQAWVIIVAAVGLLQLLVFNQPPKAPRSSNTERYVARSLTAVFVITLIWQGWLWSAALYMLAVLVLIAHKHHHEQVKSDRSA